MLLVLAPGADTAAGLLGCCVCTFGMEKLNVFDVRLLEPKPLLAGVTLAPGGLKLKLLDPKTLPSPIEVQLSANDANGVETAVEVAAGAAGVGAVAAAAVPAGVEAGAIDAGVAAAVGAPKPNVNLLVVAGKVMPPLVSSLLSFLGTVSSLGA